MDNLLLLSDLRDISIFNKWRFYYILLRKKEEDLHEAPCIQWALPEPV